MKKMLIYYTDVFNGETPPERTFMLSNCKFPYNENYPKFHIILKEIDEIRGSIGFKGFLFGRWYGWWTHAPIWLLNIVAKPAGFINEKLR